MTRMSLAPALTVAAVFFNFACSGGQPASNGNIPSNKPAVNNASNNVGTANVNTAPEDREYPKAVAEEFVKSCERSGSKREFCSCVFEKVQAKYTFEEFSVIESKIIAGQTPEDFVEFTGKARAACTR